VVKNLCFLSLVPSSHYGVQRKNRYFIELARRIGYRAELISIEDSILIAQYIKIISILNERKYTDIILRFPSPIRFILISPLFFYARLLGLKIVIEIPTPLSVVRKEVAHSNMGLRDYLTIGSLYLLPCYMCLIANRFIQYGNESSYFKLFLGPKTKIIGNPFFPDKEICIFNRSVDSINLVNFSYIGKWHGLDRLIYGLYEYYSYLVAVKNNGIEIRLDIVGDGPERERLEHLVKSLNLSDYVEFHGEISPANLRKFLAVSNIGIGTLGSHRVGLTSASPLKHRDYYCSGLPFVTDVDDLDFDLLKSYVYRVNQDESAIDVIKILEWYQFILAKNENNPELISTAMWGIEVIQQSDIRLQRALFEID
jgi:glycosyltransferase involved in cell wall biosynthesis